MHNPGFTLIEILIVLALIVLVTSMGLALSLGAHRQTLFENDVELLIYQLYQARAAAMQNKNNAPHGIRIEPNSLITFTGTSYQAESQSNESFPFSLSLVGPNTLEILFQPLSGEVDQPYTFTLTNGINNATITVNEEGAIFN